MRDAVLLVALVVALVAVPATAAGVWWAVLDGHEGTAEVASLREQVRRFAEKVYTAQVTVDATRFDLQVMQTEMTRWRAEADGAVWLRCEVKGGNVYDCQFHVVPPKTRMDGR